MGASIYPEEAENLVSKPNIVSTPPTRLQVYTDGLLKYCSMDWINACT